jgi:hypothetical protein
MMVGMMFMMRGGNGQQHGNDAAGHRDTSDQRGHDAPAEWQDSTTAASPQSTKSPTLP